MVDDAGRLLLKWMQECCPPTGMWASSTEFMGRGKKTKNKRGKHATYVLPGAEEKRVQLDYVMANRHARPLVRNCVVKWGGSITINGRPLDHALIETDLDIRVRARNDAVGGQAGGGASGIEQEQEQAEAVEAVEPQELEEGEIAE